MVMDVEFDKVFEHVMMNAIIAACNNNGVVKVLGDLAVSEKSAGANMSVDVAMGCVRVDGVAYCESTSVTNIAISAAHATLDRKDLVIYDSSADTPAAVTGVAAATPEPPDIPADDVLLAIVDVAATVTEIYDADITDGRVFISGKVAGCAPGELCGNVWKIPAGSTQGEIIYVDSTPSIERLAVSTDGYQLTTHSTGANPTWAAASDLIFSDTHCPKCGLEFQDGDDLILHVIGHNEAGDILTIPIHQSCATKPKKTVMIKRKVFENRYVLDELTGESKVQRVQKMQEKTVMKHKMKEGYGLNNKTGKAYKPDTTICNLSDAVEPVEETISEVVYEDVEYEL